MAGRSVQGPSHVTWEDQQEVEDTWLDDMPPDGLNDWNDSLWVRADSVIAGKKKQEECE
jgi:hypothetical protein